MYRDKVVAEVRKARQKVLEEAGGDVASLGAYLRRKQADERRKVVRPKPKRAHRKP